MIEIKSLTKIYPSHKFAIKDLIFSVHKGEAVGFLGMNGAGKTTTIKIIMGLIKKYTGKVSIMGHMNPITSDVYKNVGYLPEVPYFYDYLTPLESLRLYANLTGINVDFNKMIALLEMVGLKEVAQERIMNFSKGMAQRFGLAQAMINDPQLLILDEPMSGLDPVGRKDIKDVLIDLKKQGKTLFFSTHIIPDVEVICDRVIVIEKGKLLMDENIASLLSISADTYSVSFKKEVIDSQIAHVMLVNKGSNLYTYHVNGGSNAERLASEGMRQGSNLLEFLELKPTLEDYIYKTIGSRKDV